MEPEMETAIDQSGESTSAVKWECPKCGADGEIPVGPDSSMREFEAYLTRSIYQAHSLASPECVSSTASVEIPAVV